VNNLTTHVLGTLSVVSPAMVSGRQHRHHQKRCTRGVGRFCSIRDWAAVRSLRPKEFDRGRDESCRRGSGDRPRPAFAAWVSGPRSKDSARAMVYPTAAGAIRTMRTPRGEPQPRPSTRFWRDLGYAVGALVLRRRRGLPRSGGGDPLVAALTLISGLVVVWAMRSRACIGRDPRIDWRTQEALVHRASLPRPEVVTLPDVTCPKD